jgi:hypothetical protein
MSKEPRAPRPYWAAYRELLKQGWSGWWKVWVVTQASFLVAFVVHYFWLRKHVDAVANLEVHVVYGLAHAAPQVQVAEEA